MPENFGEKMPILNTNNREQQIRGKAHETYKKREAGEETGFAWQETDKMLREKGITPGTEEARKFLEKWDWAKAEKEQKKGEFVEKMAEAKKEKRFKGWRGHFGPLTELQEEAERIPGVQKQEKPPEPIKAAEQKREPLTKTELDSEWVLGKKVAKLADELGERIRAKSAAEEAKVAEKKELEKTGFETKEGEKFFTERLSNPDDPRVDRVQSILSLFFKSEELDRVEVMKEAMTGKMETGEKVPPYLVHVAENAKKEIVGVFTGAVCETVDAKGNVSEKSAVSLGFYAAVAAEMSKKGIFRNLFKAFEKSAVKDAKERGLKIKGYMGEAHDEIEEPLNKHGVKRVYMKFGKTYHELPYDQPPIDWDPATGEPAGGAGATQEHLMLKLTSEKNKVSGKDLMEMVKGMYNYNNYREREYFRSEEAYKVHVKVVKDIEQELSGWAKKMRNFHLLSAEERESLKKKGAQFNELEVGK